MRGDLEPTLHSLGGRVQCAVVLHVGPAPDYNGSAIPTHHRVVPDTGHFSNRNIANDQRPCMAKLAYCAPPLQELAPLLYLFQTLLCRVEKYT